MFKLKPISLCVLALAASLQVAAQPVPAAGAASGSTNAVPARTDVTPVQNNVVTPTAPGAKSMAAIKVAGIRFTGNTVMSEPELQALVAEANGQSMDLTGLEAVAAKVSKAYRAKGYTVARAYIPAQQSRDGVIEMAIIEGRFGEVIVNKDSPLNADLVRGILNANLCTTDSLDCKGQLVTNDASDRALLLLRDIPGMTAQATLEAGKAVGTSNYVVNVKTVKSEAYSVGYDNYGAPSIGKNRLNFSADLNNLTGKGDQLAFDVATMGTKQLTGGVSYSLPVGYMGTRAGIGYAHSVSRLGGSLASANATVMGDSASVYALHPIIRSLNASLYVRGAAEVGGGKITINGNTTKSDTTTMRLGLSGDKLDGYGGYNAYGLNSASGHFGDQLSGTNGRFNKLGYNFSRQQAIAGGFTLFGSLYGQIANAQLPAGELISIGGPNGVRAYAGGEGGNSVGGVGTLEARYTQVLAPSAGARRASLITYALFADRGWSDNFRAPGSAVAPRAIGGTGVGVTLTSPEYYLRASLARHGNTGIDASQIDPNSKSQFWLQAGLNF